MQLCATATMGTSSLCAHKVRYSGNHNILRTVGFMAILGAVDALDKEYNKDHDRTNKRMNK